MLAIAGLAATASSQHRGTVLRQLERPATLASGARLNVVRSIRPYVATVEVTPNRASLHNGLSVRLTRHARPLDGAAVSVTFSMPAMNMWHILTSRLAPAGNGVYSTTEPIFGMAGRWQLRLDVSPPGTRRLAFTVVDRMAQ